MGSVAFLGSKDIGLDVLRALFRSGHDVTRVACFDDRGDERSELEAFQELAAEAGVEVALASKSDEALPLVTDPRPDAVIVSGWYTRLDVEQADGVPFFGFHSSPLPRYRGGAPLVWQILQGESELGVSMFELVPALDEGGIVEQRHLPFPEDGTIADALEWARSACAEMTSANIDAIVGGSPPMTAQDHALATYCSQRIPEDGLIDWSDAARAVHDFVRAQTRPYPGAFTRLPDGSTLRVWKTEVDPREYVGPPGGVVERAGGHAVVTCGEQAVRILEAQVDGAEPAEPPAILDSLKIRLA